MSISSSISFSHFHFNFLSYTPPDLPHLQSPSSKGGGAVDEDKCSGEEEWVVGGNGGAEEGEGEGVEEGAGEVADLAEKKKVGHAAASRAVDEDECGREEGWVGDGKGGTGRSG